MIFKKRGAHSSAIFEKGNNFCDPNRKDGKTENGRITPLGSVCRHLKSRFSYINLVLIFTKPEILTKLRTTALCKNYGIKAQMKGKQNVYTAV